jgi:hypothetical protein
MATRVKIFTNPKYKRNGHKSLIYTLRKYGITPAEGTTSFYRTPQKTLMMKSDTGSDTEVTAENQQNDAFWLCPVTVGTPGQKLMLVRRHNAPHVYD